MPIEHWGHGGLTITGESIHYAQLIAQRATLKFELTTGLRMHRGPVLWRRLRDHYGIPKLSKRTGKPIKGKANKMDVYLWLCAKVEELGPKQLHVYETDSGPESDLSPRD